jgi:Domain of unknown function (DUF6285)
MRDLPSGPALLALARDVLLNDLLPLLPDDSRLDARLVANSMAIAEREAEAGCGSEEAVTRELETLYGDGPDPNPPPQRGGGRDQRSGRVGAEAMELLQRFARDLRIGAFEGSEPRDGEARAIMWRLTLAKLREANPRFLAANGLR